MESLKALAARSVAARITSKECLQRLEVPKSLFGDLLLAHEDSWRKLRIKKQTMCENRLAEKKSTMVNMKHDCRIKGVLSEKSLSKKKNVESTKKKGLEWVMSMESWKKCPYCKFSPVLQKKVFWHISKTKSCKMKQEQFLTSTEEKKFFITWQNLA